MLAVIDEALFGERANHNRRYARTVAPNALHRRRNVVPAAAVLVVSNDDQRVVPVLALLHCIHNLRHVLLSLEEVGIARMFIVRTERLDKGHGRQCAVLHIGEEVVLILQVRGRGRVHLSIHPRSVVVVVSKWLMVPLEQRVHRRVRRRLPIVHRIARCAQQCIVPTT